MMGMTITLGATLRRIMMIGNYDSDEHGDERDDYILMLARVVLCIDVVCPVLFCAFFCADLCLVRRSIVLCMCFVGVFLGRGAWCVVLRRCAAVWSVVLRRAD